MRVTNSMLVSNFMNNLNHNASRLDKLQNQMTSGKKYAHVSDDPVSVIYSQQARYRLTRLTNYQKNLDTAESWLTQAESGLMSLNEIIKNAYEACIDGSTDVKTEEDKQNVAKYVAQMRDQVLHTLNTAFGTKYVFGGYDTTGYQSAGGTISPPFTVENGNLCYNGCDLTDPANAATVAHLKGDVLTFDLGIGIDMEVAVNGITASIFNSDGDNLYNLLDNLYNDLQNGEGAEVIDKHISKLQDAQHYLLGEVATIGGKMNRLELLSSRYEQDHINYTQMLSDAEDADEAEVIMNFKMAQSVYQAALAAGASIIQPTLMDFLR
jgi:flagellar hook-associated protein 3 FlgL